MAEVKPILTEEAFETVFQTIRDTRKKKKADYAKSYADAGDGLGNLGKAGWEGIVIRMQDKLDRLNGFALQNVIEGHATPMNESIEDAFLDTAVYAILGLLVYRSSTSWRKDRALSKEDIAWEGARYRDSWDPAEAGKMSDSGGA